jgi:thiamine-phosphate pyrophosphorylase
MKLPEKLNDPNLLKLQFITNQWSQYSIEEQVKTVADAGCKWIQLRLKDKSYEEWLKTAKEVKTVCQNQGAMCIVNDHVEVALKMDADGVHLGKEDMDPEKARNLLGPDKIIGATANTLDDVLKLSQKKPDYIGLGPLRKTNTKKKLSPELGFQGYKEVLEELDKRNITVPIVAIGGVTTGDFIKLQELGIRGIAVSSFISHHENPSSAVETLLNELNMTHHA